MGSTGSNRYTGTFLEFTPVGWGSEEFPVTAALGENVLGEGMVGKFKGAAGGALAIRPWLFDWPTQAGQGCTATTAFALVFLAGDRAELLVLRADDTSEVLALGNNLAAGERPTVALQAGDTFALRLKPGGTGGWGLLGYTSEDATQFTSTDGAKLAERFPDRAEWFKAAGTLPAKP